MMMDLNFQHHKEQLENHLKEKGSQEDRVFHLMMKYMILQKEEGLQKEEQ